MQIIRNVRWKSASNRFTDCTGAAHGTTTCHFQKAGRGLNEVKQINGLNLYLLFTCSWFLHLPSRIPALGVIRFDLLLIVILSVIAFKNRPDDLGKLKGDADKFLKILIIYVLITIPFVEWPGSVVKLGFPNLVKAVVFYFFTITFIRNEHDLKKFVYVFLGCQLIRILEPLYLNMTSGYWGSWASIYGGSDFMARLSGSPYDSVNPNGLAYLVFVTLPFLYFLQSIDKKHKLAFLVLTPALLYVLALTGSRSGLLVLFVLFAVLVLKSRHRVLLITASLVAAVVGFSSMSPEMKDRYLSTFGKGEMHQQSADDRLSGLTQQLEVGFRRPIFGYGLGTSAEANYHYSGPGPYFRRDIPSHNLYIEAFQELGIIGLIILLLFMKSIIRGFLDGKKNWDGLQQSSGFVPRFIEALKVWFYMNIIFSFASYGLSSYDWYLYAGFLLVLKRLAENAEVATGEPAPAEVPARNNSWYEKAR